MRLLACLFCLIVTIPAAYAGDTYMIARLEDGSFSASHKIFREPQVGYKHVRMCKQDFWVLPMTVAWAMRQEANGSFVQIEGNSGHGWKIHCRKPTSQVTLKQVGIYVPLDEIESGVSPKQSLLNRFAAIRNTFNNRDFIGDVPDDEVEGDDNQPTKEAEKAAAAKRKLAEPVDPYSRKYVQ